MKFWQKILVVFGVIFLVLALLRVVGQGTGVFGIYNISSEGNSPAIEKGENIFVSNTLEPEVLDFIAYKYNFDNPFDDKEEFLDVVWIHRLIAKEGDEVLIKNNYAIVNGVEIDKELNLKMGYLTDFHGKNSLSDLFKISKESIFQKSKYQYIINLSKNEFETVQGKIELVPLVLNSSEGLHLDFQKASWTSENIGPFIVPKGKYFVLGDNRHAVMDARFIGFIPIKDVLGVKL